jgi:hypothetical protein
MQRTYIRANLEISRAVEVADPSGERWTVYVIRTGEPHSPWIRVSNSYWWAVTVNRLRRALKRDHRWNIEVVKGPMRPDLRTAKVLSTLPSKAAALQHAESVAVALSTGAPLPGP